MHRGRPLVSSLLTLVFVLPATVLSAQTPPGQPGVTDPPVLVPRQSIRVTLTDGTVLKGSAVRATADTIEFVSRDRLRLVRLADVSVIQTVRRDPPWDGLAYGAGSGAAILGILAFIVGPGDCPPYGFCLRFSRGEVALMGATFGALFGAPIGFAGDLFTPTVTTVYRRRGPAVSAAPLVSPGGGGAVVAIRW